MKRGQPSCEESSTTEKLLSAARTMFRERGYAHTSMDELCAQVGLTRGALYHHFGGKSGLLEAVVLQIHAEMGEELDAKYDASADPWQGFRACCRRYLEMALDPERKRIVFLDAPAVLGDKSRKLDQESIEPIRESLIEAMDAGKIVRRDPEALARLLHGAACDAAIWIAASKDPERTLERSLEALDALLEGLART